MINMRNKKIKIAIVLSGMQKMHERSIASIKEIEKNYETKIFCHCWENNEKINNYCFNSRAFNLPNEPAETILKKYQNIFYRISDNRKYKNIFDHRFKSVKNNNGASNSSFLSQFYSMRRANSLKKRYEIENNCVFDCVIRMRFDSLISIPIIFENHNLEKINTQPSYYVYSRNVPAGRPKGINDQFAFGPSKLMDCFFDAYKNMVTISNEGTCWCPHAILAEHLLRNKIEVIFDERILVKIHNS